MQVIDRVWIFMQKLLLNMHIYALKNSKIWKKYSLLRVKKKN